MLKSFRLSNVTIFTGAYLIIIGSLFFAATSAYQYCIQQPNFVKWSAPDEAANYYFSKLYAQTGQLSISNNLVLPEAEIVRPRSFKANDGILKPMSFLGLPLLYGWIASWASIEVLPYLTPLFGVLGLWFFFGLVKRIFNPSTATVATTIAAAFPVYLYFSAKSMFHNVLFLTACLISLYFGVRALERRRAAIHRPRYQWLALPFLAISGLAFGWAVATRTSELLWLGPSLVLLIIFYFKEIGWYRWLWWLSWAGTAILPVAYWNQILHGSWYGGGYPQMSQSIDTLGRTSLSLFNWQGLFDGSLLMTKLKILETTIFHFGFWPQQSWTVFYHYVVNMFPWLLPLAIVGIGCFVFNIRQWSKEKWLFLIVWLMVSSFLVLYYGSWKFNDNPDPNSFTIGNSYTRYWLPVYFGALPWAAEGLRRLIRFFCRHQVARSVIVAAVAVIGCCSLRFVAIGSEEGLIYSGQRQIADYNLLAEIMARTESNSLIITRYQDKLFFPERQVIVGLFDNDVINQYYGRLLQDRPVYYFNFRLPEADWQYLNNRRLVPFGYKLKEVWQYQKFSLYKLELTGQRPTKTKAYVAHE